MAPPDPLPNSEVKHRSANGSVVRPCESRSSSALYSEYPSTLACRGIFFVRNIFLLCLGIYF